MVVIHFKVFRATGLTHLFNFLTLGHSGTQSLAPECPNVKKIKKMVGQLTSNDAERFNGRLILQQSKSVELKGLTPFVCDRRTWCNHYQRRPITASCKLSRSGEADYCFRSFRSCVCVCVCVHVCVWCIRTIAEKTTEISNIVCRQIWQKYASWCPWLDFGGSWCWLLILRAILT